MKPNTDCEGKVRFESFEVANKARGRRKGRSVYLCRSCHGFHVGTPPPRAVRNAAKRPRVEA